MAAFKSRPRVAFVTPGSFPIPSGRSSSVEEVVVQLTRALRDSADIDIYGRRFRGYPAKSRRYGAAFIRPFAGKEGKRYISAVCRKMKGIDYDVIQVENRPRYVKALKSAFPRTPVWLSLHSLTFVSKKVISTRNLRACLTKADRIIVNSRFLRESLLQRFPELEASVHVRYLGVDREQFTSRWTEEGMRLQELKRKSLGLSGRKIIVFVGRLLPVKGVHHLLAAMPGILRRVPEAHLVVVGGAFYGSRRQTSYVHRLHRMARAVRGRVTFVPYVAHERIHEWFRLADAVAVPSCGREAFGLVNVEAMATGVPVVATRSGGMVEIVEDGVTGYLIDPGRIREELTDRLSSLLSDDALRNTMGLASIRAIEERFTWRHAADRFLSLLGESRTKIWRRELPFSAPGGYRVEHNST